MIKNAILYKISGVLFYGAPFHEILWEQKFTPCGLTQEKSYGWIPPRGEGDALAEYSGDWVIFKMRTETKSVPSSVIKSAVAKKCELIEHQTGRKPGKKERREMSEDCLFSLLPQAFPKQSDTLIFINRKSGMTFIGASSYAKTDDVISLLMKAFSSLQVEFISTQTDPNAMMANCLVTGDAPNGFSIDRECELKAIDESKSVVKYGRHSLDISEIPNHIASGKIPTKLAMTWNDRVSFVLTDEMNIKKINLLDIVFEEKHDNVDQFDADIAIFTGEFSRLVSDLIAALGGE